MIDQAKGMLILLYGVDDQTAFDTLRRHSQNTNIKLRALAEQLVSNYRALSNGDGDPRSLDDCLSERDEGVHNHNRGCAATSASGSFRAL